MLNSRRDTMRDRGVMENKQTSFEAIQIEKLLFERGDYLFPTRKAFFITATKYSA